MWEKLGMNSLEKCGSLHTEEPGLSASIPVRMAF